MNPPFGTRKKGADMEFLSAAMKVKDRKENLFLLFLNFVSLDYMVYIQCFVMQVASKAVYSLHKTSTREVSKAFFFAVLLSINA